MAARMGKYHGVVKSLKSSPVLGGAQPFPARGGGKSGNCRSWLANGLPGVQESWT